MREKHGAPKGAPLWFVGKGLVTPFAERGEDVLGLIG